MTHLSISLLGGFGVTLDGKPVTGFGSNKVRALLAYLATETDRAHSREKLAALLWPDMPDREARNNLRYALSNLRKAIGGPDASQPFLCISWQTIQLNLAGEVEVDVLTFNRCLAQSPLTLSNLERAVSLYRGDFLEGFSIGDDMAFDEWVILKQEQLQRQVLDALHRLAQTYEKNGDISSALPYAWRQVELEPWSEEAHRYLMRLLALGGQRSAALAQYEACQRALAEELDVAPSIETTRLYEQIRDGEIAPLHQAQATGGQPAEQSPGGRVELSGNSELLPAIPDARRPKTGAVLPHWLKILAGGLLMLSLILAAIYFSRRQAAGLPAIAPARGKIVMPCSGQAARQICIANAQTGQLTPLTDNLPIDRIGPGLSWAPGGGKIVFSASSKPRQGMNEDFDLYLIDADGSNLQQITPGNANDVMPAWSPDGLWIAFHRDCNLWIMHPDGAQAEPLSFGLCVTGIAWSPDSQWIAFIDQNRGPEGQLPLTIRVFRWRGNESRIIYTFSQSVNGGRLAWSPDGQQIFCEYATNDSKGGTLLIDANGQGVVKQGIEIPANWFQDFWPEWGSEK
jgi:DNA-binding SARP family transcriptional activator/Tol biopolymer transport system component